MKYDARGVMRWLAAVSVVMGAWLANATAIDAASPKARRQLGAHEHGKAGLTVAIEGPRLELALEIPADDVVGFERAPASAAEKQTLEKALKALREGGRIVQPTPAAGCKMQSAKVHATGSLASTAKSGRAGGGHDSEAHAEFHASYVFECGQPRKLDGLALALFKVFPNVKAVHVTMIGPKGQAAVEVDAAGAELPLAGVN